MWTPWGMEHTCYKNQWNFRYIARTIGFTEWLYPNAQAREAKVLLRSYLRDEPGLLLLLLLGEIVVDQRHRRRQRQVVVDDVAAARRRTGRRRQILTIVRVDLLVGHGDLAQVLRTRLFGHLDRVNLPDFVFMRLDGLGRWILGNCALRLYKNHAELINLCSFFLEMCFIF